VNEETIGRKSRLLVDITKRKPPGKGMEEKGKRAGRVARKEPASKFSKVLEGSQRG